jgi:hypothetical protein
MRMMGWLAALSCLPLIGSAWDPPLQVILPLWALAGAGGAYQLVAAATFVQALQPASRARAFGLAQSGLYAVQGLGILAGGAVAQAIGPPLAVGLARPDRADRGRHARRHLGTASHRNDSGRAGRSCGLRLSAGTDGPMTR